jgi:hypothetical protein
MRAGFANVQDEMRAGFANVQDEMRAGFASMRSGFADLKVTIVTRLPTRESSEEMVRLLREGNRLQEERFTQIDLRSREQHLATQHVLHSLVESHQRVVEEQRVLAAEQRGLSQDIKALIVRLDAMFRRDNGGPAG